MRAAPLGLLVMCLGVANVLFYTLAPSPELSSSALSDLISILILPIGVIGGLVYGVVLANWVTRNLERTGVSRPTRRRLISALIAIVVVLSVYFWFLGFVFTIIRPLIIGTFSLLASMFAAQSLVYWRWERRAGKMIEYEGVWGIRVVDRNPSAPELFRKT